MLMMDSGEAGLLTGVVAPRAEEEELSLSLGAVILLLQLMVAVTVECGGGTKQRSRHCNSPAPLHGGDQCSGD